jgi:RND family efflux transporter MFP subunit
MRRFLTNRRLRIAAAIAIVGVPIAWLFARGPAPDDLSLVAAVRRGAFSVTVTPSGELKAREFVQITAPAQAQQAGAFQMKIASIVPEGTLVKQGDLVAEIDRSTLANRLQEVTLALQKAEAQYEQAMLDSTLTLSTARETIRSMELGLEERKLAKEQAVYEAPTVKRQAEIDYEKAERALAQARTDYVTRTEQAKAKMREVGADVARQRNLLGLVTTVMAGFTIRAPASGMVIYVTEWNGRKRTTGSQVSSWDPAVATLPDLTQMESVTYVNEIDVRKVAAGQPVVITLDADPSKRLTGRVTSVANVGEQRPNADAKVYEVKVIVEQSDTTLRPGMTTGNTIETFRTDDALFIPIEAINNDGGVTIVYKQSGGGVVKQEVVTGAMNEDDVIVLEGLTENDRVLLSQPTDPGRLALVRLPGSPVDSTAAGGDTALRVPLGASAPDTGPRPPPPSPPKSGTQPRSD